MRRPLLVLLAACALAACGGGSAEIAQPIAVQLQVDSSDLDGGTLIARAKMDDQPGAPYAAFMQAAQSKLGGASPSSVDVIGGSLALVPGKDTTVTALSDVFGPGQVETRFVMGLEPTAYPVGTFEDVSDAGTAQLNASFSSSGLPGVDQTDLLGGNFWVEVAGPANPAFVTGGSQAHLRVQLTFEAHE